MPELEYWDEEVAKLQKASPEELKARLQTASTTAMPLFSLLGKVHTLEIIYEIAQHDSVRFNELKSALNASSATLSARLTELVDAGFLERTSHDEIPPRVEYNVTDKAIDLKPVFYHLLVWSENHDFSTNSSNEQ